MKRFMAFNPQLGMQSYGDPTTDALTAYNASPMSGVVGVAADLGGLYVAWLLHEKHPVWAGVIGLISVGGLGYNLFKLGAIQK